MKTLYVYTVHTHVDPAIDTVYTIIDHPKHYLCMAIQSHFNISEVCFVQDSEVVFYSIKVQVCVCVCVCVWKHSYEYYY